MWRRLNWCPRRTTCSCLKACPPIWPNVLMRLQRGANLDSWLDDLFHRTDHGVPPPETSGSAQVRLSHPLFSGPQPSGGSFQGLRGRAATRKSPYLTSGPTFIALRPWKRVLSASDSRPMPRRAIRILLSGCEIRLISPWNRPGESRLGAAFSPAYTRPEGKAGTIYDTSETQIRRF